jgi:hypothetical protein
LEYVLSIVKFDSSHVDMIWYVLELMW